MPREAARCLKPGGRLFISELHPFRQYGGLKANFEFGEATVTIPAFVHAISDFLDAGREHGFALLRLAEWWHQPDRNKAPLVVSFLFEK